jgi:hypothetical protein
VVRECAVHGCHRNAAVVLAEEGAPAARTRQDSRHGVGVGVGLGRRARRLGRAGGLACAELFVVDRANSLRFVIARAAALATQALERMRSVGPADPWAVRALACPLRDYPTPLGGKATRVVAFHTSSPFPRSHLLECTCRPRSPLAPRTQQR